MGKRFSKGSIVGLVLLALTLPMAGAGASAQDPAAPEPASIVPCSTQPLTSIRGKQVELCSPIVFADSKSGDLWVTDEYGAGPIRLTRTPMTEDNPSSMGYWIAYDAGPRDGGSRDVYLMSILGGARVKLTGLGSDDWDPSLGQPLDPYSGFGMPIVYASDRHMGKGGGACGVELFMELHGITSPERVTVCDRRDKVDPELAYDNSTVAYTGIGPKGFDVWVTEVGGQMRLTSGADRGAFPTWSPAGDDAPISGPRAAAGSETITYSSLSQGDAGALNDINRDGTGDVEFIAPLNNQTAMIDAEWETTGYRIAFAVQKGTSSRIGWAHSDGSIGDPSVTTTQFYVTGLDWISPDLPQ